MKLKININNSIFVKSNIKKKELEKQTSDGCNGVFPLHFPGTSLPRTMRHILVARPRLNERKGRRKMMGSGGIFGNHFQFRFEFAPRYIVSLRVHNVRPMAKMCSGASYFSLSFFSPCFYTLNMKKAYSTREWAKYVTNGTTTALIIGEERGEGLEPAKRRSLKFGRE